MKLKIDFENPEGVPIVDIEIFIDDVYAKHFDKFEKKLIKSVKTLLE